MSTNSAVSSAFESLWTPIKSEDEQSKGLRGYVGTLEEALVVLKAYELASSLKINKNFETSSGLGDNCLRNASKKVCFLDRQDGTIPADGVPFMTVRHISYACEYGRDKNAKSRRSAKEDREKMLRGESPSQRRYKRIKRPESKKLGCKAVVHVKQTAKFIDYTDIKNGYQKKKASEAIRGALLKGENPAIETRFYIRLPSREEHLETHDIGEYTVPNRSLLEGALLNRAVSKPLRNPFTNKGSGMTCHALRLRPGEELRGKLFEYVQNHGLKAAFILTCVGSLQTVSLRMADSVTMMHIEKNLEIVSLVGTLSGGHGHLHMSLSDELGNVVGGHLLGDAVVFSTAEVVIGEIPHLSFSREPDPETGYDELVIEKR
ncbi:uncharacterized protein LOC129264298 isoform X2 [Lytechinus pictus]|uniref:uncharacterized protein LOC129264298 isoform X2 n=1 Tax=Lytechinus pictus TaxID=7653 RepID=UPI00240D3D9F|nr:uncharacterized protein LOC129264298 [Lytechinus pictus]XP_054758123.1 uncharacterized protein LOC129264298 [Lytechinus pictus]